MFNKDKEKPAVAEPKKEARRHGSGNMSGVYFKIEVRTTAQPRVLNAEPHPFVIDGEWRNWPFEVRQGQLHPAPSVPCGPFDRHAGEHGLLAYDAAMAHQYAIFAFFNAGGIFRSAYDIQTRLVAIKWEENYSTEEVGVSDPMTNPENPYKAFKDRDAVNVPASELP